MADNCTYCCSYFTTPNGGIEDSYLTRPNLQKVSNIQEGAGKGCWQCSALLIFFDIVGNKDKPIHIRHSEHSLGIFDPDPDVTYDVLLNGFCPDFEKSVYRVTMDDTASGMFDYENGEKSGVRTPGNGTNESLHWSVVGQPSQLLQPVPPMKLKIPLAAWLPTEEATESEREAVRWPELYFYYSEDRKMTPEEANGRLKVVQREIFDIERPDETGRRYLPLIRGERFCNASPSWLQTGGDDSEGRFQVLDETESQSQTTEQWRTTADATYAETPSALGSVLPGPVAYKSYAASSSSYATASDSYGATNDPYATSTASVPYDSSSSTGMPTGRDVYQESQEYQKGYQRGYQEGYEYGYQKGTVAAQGSAVYDATYNRDYSRSYYDDQNHETTNADRQGYPDRGPGYDITLATSEQIYNQDPETDTVDDEADTETKSANTQDDERHQREYEAERHRRSRQKSSSHQRLYRK